MIAKKVIIFIITMSMLFSVFTACSVRKTIPGAQDIYIVSPLNRLSPTTQPESLNTDTLSIVMAKNEKEGAQFVLRSETNVYENINLSAEPLKTSDGINEIPVSDIELFHLEYARPKGERTDANLMMPLSDPDFNNLTSVAGENLIYYIRVSTDCDTPSGEYSGEVILEHKTGTINIPLKVTVIDFELQTRPVLKTDMLYWTSFVERFYGDKLTKEQAYDFFAEAVGICRENKITIRTRYDEPSMSDFEPGQEAEYAAAVKKFLEDNPTVTIFNIPVFWKESYKTINTERTLPAINALRDAGILQYGLLCTIDEPHEPAHYEALREIGEWIQTYAPDVNHYVTTFPTQIDMSIVNPEHITTWCSIYPLIDIPTLKYYQSEYGAQFWGYGFDKGLDIDLNNIRTIGWELKKFDMLGLEDWCVNSYTSYYSPETNWILTLEDAYKFAWFFPGMEGDGVVNKNKQIVTLTLENVRDTIEDYEYLIALENRISETIDKLGLNITVDEAMESYYDALFLDVHKLPENNYKAFTATRNTIIKEILNGVDFIMITEQDPVKWVNDNRDITIYTAPEADIKINGETPDTQIYDTYAKHSYYIEMPINGTDVEIAINGEKTVRHLLCKDYSKAEVLELNEETLSAIKEANPNTEAEIITVNGLKTLKLTFTQLTKRGINIPSNILKNQFGSFPNIRFNAWTDSTSEEIYPQFIVKTPSSLLISWETDDFLSNDPSQIFTLNWGKSLTSEAEKMNNLIITLNKFPENGEPVTLYINNLYYIDESNHFEWIIW